MACRIDLRHDQSESLIKPTTLSGTGIGVCIFAPSWVEQGMDFLTAKLDGVKFEVHSYPNCQSGGSTKSTICEEFRINVGTSPITLARLQMIARCEPRNVTGVINKLHYSPAGLSDEVIYAIRDLVRQCIIVGLDETTHYGGKGYGSLP